MKIERLSQDKIRIFLTFDDLSERGIQKDDMWREIPKVHDLFSEMMDQAYQELGFDASGPLAVEVFSMPAQGMIVIVTRGRGSMIRDEDDDYEQEDIYDVEISLEQTDLISYEFKEFDDLVRAAKVLVHQLGDGSVHHYKNRYILQIDSADMEERQYDGVIAVLSEFGEVSSVTEAVLEEYGKVVMPKQAIETLCRYF